MNVILSQTFGNVFKVTDFSLSPLSVTWAYSIGVDGLNNYAMLELIPGTFLLLLDVFILNVLLLMSNNILLVLGVSYLLLGSC